MIFDFLNCVNFYILSLLNKLLTKQDTVKKTFNKTEEAKNVGEKQKLITDVKFIIATSKNPEPPLQIHFRNNICYVIDETDV